MYNVKIYINPKVNTDNNRQLQAIHNIIDDIRECHTKRRKKNEHSFSVPHCPYIIFFQGGGTQY